MNMSSSSSCISQDSSTAILSSNMDLPSSSSPFSTFTTGSRAIDRHNPIITDEKRSGNNSSSCTTTPMRTPCTNNVLQQKPTNTPILVTTPKNSPKQKKNKLTNKLITKKKTATATTTEKTTPISSENSNYNHNISIEGDDDDDSSSYCGKEGLSKPSDMIMKAAVCTKTKPGVEYMSPPESSRYLLDDTSFLEVLSDFDPVLKLMPTYDSSNNKNNGVDNAEVGCQSSDDGCRPPKPSSSSASSDQVVVLRVSLHCRGCERKMKKHLSRMPGVTSFNIDFAAKKVTVVGDVTPLGVLASISKVKTAKLWTPVMPPSSQLNSKNMQLNK